MSHLSDRRMSLPIEQKGICPTPRILNTQQTLIKNKENDFYDKPYARCIDCLCFKTRCHNCLHHVLNTLRSWKEEEKIKIKEPSKSTKKVKQKIVIKKSQKNYNISNLSVRKTQENAGVITFEQPVLHKNTILYCVNPFLSPQPKIHKDQNTTNKFKRNLLVNFSYRNQRGSPQFQNPENQIDSPKRKNIYSTRKSIASRLAATMILQKKRSFNISNYSPRKIPK